MPSPPEPAIPITRSSITRGPLPGNGSKASAASRIRAIVRRRVHFPTDDKDRRPIVAFVRRTPRGSRAGPCVGTPAYPAVPRGWWLFRRSGAERFIRAVIDHDPQQPPDPRLGGPEPPHRFDQARLEG